MSELLKQVHIENLDPEQTLEALLEARRRRPDLDLTCREATAYVEGLLPDEADFALVERHLWDCPLCRGAVADLLQQSANAGSTRARRFLERVERYESLRDVAERTAEDVRARHRQHGVSLVYEKDGELIEEMPDGEIRPFDPASVLPSEPY